MLTLLLPLFLFIWQARNDGAMVLNGKSDPRDTTYPANRRDFGFHQQVKMHTLTKRRARLFLFLINLNFYRQRLNNTRYLFGARLLFLQYYIVHFCF